MLPYDLACLFGIILAFYGLDQSTLWLDEAETGFVAKGVLAYGWPLAQDGHQLYPGFSRYYNEALVWIELPLLPFYVAALSFLFWEPDTWSARLPFVMIGLLSLPLIYRITQRLFDTPTAQLTLLLLLYSVPFLMHIRQSRYFSLLIFGTIWGVWAYLRCKDSKPHALLHFAAAAILLFHSHYGYFFGYMVRPCRAKISPLPTAD